MENLKQNIDKTETLKNNLKTVTNQIKQSIVRGGYDIKSLAESPKRITEMLGQYSKFAKISTNIEFTMPGPYKDVTVEVPLNLDFVPKLIFFNLHQNGKSHYMWANSDTGLNVDNYINHGYFIKIYGSDFIYVGKDKFTLKVSHSYQDTYRISQVYAIG